MKLSALLKPVDRNSDGTYTTACPVCSYGKLWLASDGTCKAQDQCDCDLSPYADPTGTPPGSSPVQEATDEADSEPKEERGKPTCAQRLIEIGSRAELFHSDRSIAYAAFPVSLRNETGESVKHRETWQIRSRAFKDWLTREFYEDAGRPPTSQGMQDALGLLEAKARYDGTGQRDRCAFASRPIRWVRCDLTTSVRPNGTAFASRRRDGTSSNSRPSSIATQRPAQVTPTHGGNLNALRRFVNVKDDNAWYLLIAWMVAALMPELPHPVFAIGEQGSCKSSLARLLGQLIDPSRTPLRSQPRDLGEWVQIGDHTWMPVLNNLSNLPEWLSDALCRACTGEGFGEKRMLYSDSDDVLIEFRRVVILTGIECVVSRPDLLDRSILVSLEPIKPEDRRAEAEIERRWTNEPGDPRRAAGHVRRCLEDAAIGEAAASPPAGRLRPCGRRRGTGVGLARTVPSW